MPSQQDEGRPHLIPSSLVGQRFPRNTFGNTKIAIIGYCPPPRALGKYDPTSVSDQHFIHVSPESVKRFSHNGIQFLSLVHVYGGPVSASTVEELAYYDFDYILAYGLAGGLGTKQLQMGDFYLVDSALVADGTTPHYTNDPVVFSDKSLRAKILKLVKGTELKDIRSVRAITGDAIYREDQKFLRVARRSNCDVVNLDSSHLFAVSVCNSNQKRIKTIECGVISDVSGGANEGWDSTLSAMLSPQGSGGINPLESTAAIIDLYVERLAPILLQKGTNDRPNKTRQRTRADERIL
jgi:uridine phosphorylase